MNVLEQALSVAEKAESAGGRVTLTLDLDEPGQRAAYAAALAVLQISGIDVEAVSRPSELEQPAEPIPPPPPAPEPPAADDAELAAGAEADERDAAIRRSYGEALSELTPDDARRNAILRDTFARVRDLLRNGANVGAVAQIQYRRWTEEHLDARQN